MIDVSQSVERDHPHALDFLRSDCTNVNDFFRRQGVGTMSLMQLFHFITDPCITEKTVESHLDKLQNELAEPDKAEELVFKQAYIPKNLYEVCITAYYCGSGCGAEKKISECLKHP